MVGYSTGYDNVDLVTIRENTEGEYSGIEHEVGEMEGGRERGKSTQTTHIHTSHTDTHTRTTMYTHTHTRSGSGWCGAKYQAYHTQSLHAGS